MTARNGPSRSIAFLLAQVGDIATQRFAERLAPLGLTNAQAGLLRLISADPGRSQQHIADRLGVAPSRLVALLDDLEAHELLQRRRSTQDRRVSTVHLTGAGQRALGEVAQSARAHNEEMCAGLDQKQQADLVEMLSHIAGRLGLEPDIHPGYGRLKGSDT